ncbi:MAG: hypothetical protein IPM98_08530 [Lewinellaceae bacterium]|nr:hypothetical protein [Lewinellaceae bacterium]
MHREHWDFCVCRQGDWVAESGNPRYILDPHCRSSSPTSAMGGTRKFRVFSPHSFIRPVRNNPAAYF